MTDTKIVVGHAFNPRLDAFHLVNGLLLKRVCRAYALGSLKRLALDFEQLALVIMAEAELDTVQFVVQGGNVQLADEYVDATASPLWSKFIGLTFGWGWITINQQGYCDGVLLSFDGITPQIFLNVVASSIKENVIERCTEAPGAIR